MQKSFALGAGLVFICILITANVNGQVSPDRLAAINISVYPTPCPLNDMPLRDLKGNQISLASYKGTVVLLNFWKIECPPCAVEKPLLENMHRRHARNGLSVLAVNLFDDQNRIREYVRGGGFTYTFASDPDRRLRVQTQTLPSGAPTCFVINPKAEAIYEISMVPTTYVIDRGGRIVARASGLVNWAHPDAERFLEGLLEPPPLAGAEAVFTRARNGAHEPIQLAVATSYKSRAADQPDEGPLSTVQPGAILTADWSQPAKAETGAGAVSGASARPPKTVTSERPAIEKKVGPSKTKQAQEGPTLIKPSRRAAAPSPNRPVPSRSGNQEYGYNTPARQAQTPAMLGQSHEDYTSARRTRPTSPTSGASRPLPATLPPATRYVDPAAEFTPISRPTAETPRTSSSPAPTVIPDSRGYVTARVPPNSSRSLLGYTQRPSDTGPATWQYPTPVRTPAGARSPLTEFVLDSFNSPEATRSVSQQPSPPSTFRGPASLILNPLQQFGVGIKDTVSKIIPGR